MTRLGEVVSNQEFINASTAITVGTDAHYNFSNYASPQAAIQAAIDASTAIGATIVINASCTLTASVNPKSNVHITCLPGVVITFNSGHVNGVPVSPNDGFHAFETSEEISNFSIYGLRFNGGLTVLQTGVDGVEYHAIYIRHGSHDFTVKDIYGTRVASGVLRFRDSCYGFTAKNIEAYEADCAVICTVGCNNFTLDNIRATSCFAEGLFLGSDVYNFALNNIYASNAGTCGLSINNVYTSTTRAGIRANISNVQIYNSTLKGINLVGCDELNLNNIYCRGNQHDGILLDDCNNITINNAQLWSNNQVRATDSTSTYAGIRANNCIGLDIIGAIYDDDGGTICQYRGLSTSGTTDYVNAVGGRVSNTISSSQSSILGGNSTALSFTGYNTRRYHNNGNVSAAPTILLKNGDIQYLGLIQNTTLSTLETNVIAGQTLIIITRQDSTGGWTFTLPSNITLLSGAWSPNTSANATAVLSLIYVNSTIGWLEISRSG